MTPDAVTGQGCTNTELSIFGVSPSGQPIGSGRALNSPLPALRRTAEGRRPFRMTTHPGWDVTREICLKVVHDDRFRPGHMTHTTRLSQTTRRTL
jgi:hypothetical protein